MQQHRGSGTRFSTGCWRRAQTRLKQSCRGSTASLLYAGAGIGILGGFLALARFGSRWAALPVLIAGLAVSSLGNLLTGLAWAAAAALVFQIMRGLGIAAIDLGLTLHVQRTVPGNLQGRTFGILYGGAGRAAGIAYLFGGWLLHETDARITFTVAGIGGLLATLVTGVTLRQADERNGGPGRRGTRRRQPR